VIASRSTTAWRMPLMALSRSRQAEKAGRERDNAMSGMRQAVVERDAITEKLKERDQWVDQLAKAVTEQRAAISELSQERDAARQAADQARSLIDELTRQLRTIMPTGAPRL